MIKYLSILSLFLAFSCTTETISQNTKTTVTDSVLTIEFTEDQSVIFENAKTIKDRFVEFGNYKRQELDTNSFAYYLRNLALKPFGEKVKYYNGAIKNNEGVNISVVNMKIGKRDLQQCADAVMRLRGEYLYQRKEYNQIHFNFLSDGKPRYFNDYAKGDYSYKKFTKYMDYIFSYANTGSLHKELVKVNNINDIQIGDVFIQTGNPYGHAIIVVDLMQNPKGKKVILLAQSYMPAQETQILINPNNSNISPWYKLDNKNGNLETPEWSFTYNDLRRFK